jgi:hypothetical protein
MSQIECLDPACTGVPTARPQLSTWAGDVYFCARCKRTFSVPTFLGKLRDFAPTVIAGCAIIGLGVELDHMDDAASVADSGDIYGGGV